MNNQYPSQIILKIIFYIFQFAIAQLYLNIKDSISYLINLVCKWQWHESCFLQTHTYRQFISISHRSDRLIWLLYMKGVGNLSRSQRQSIFTANIWLGLVIFIRVFLSSNFTNIYFPYCLSLSLFLLFSCYHYRVMSYAFYDKFWSWLIKYA